MCRRNRLALLRKVEQAPAQPFELPAEALQILRTRHRDGARQGATAELADGFVQCPQRPSHGEGDGDDGDSRQGYQQRRQPKRAASGGLRAKLERGDLRVDLGVALLAHLGGERRQLTEALGKVAQIRRAPRHGHHAEPDRSLLLPKLLERLVCRRGAQLSAELRASRRETFVLGAVDVEHRLVVEHIVEACRALELGDLPGQFLAGARGRHAFGDEFLALIGEHPDLQARIDERNEQWHGNECQTEQHQAAQGLGPWPTHGRSL